MENANQMPELSQQLLSSIPLLFVKEKVKNAF